jgi:aspartyl-tRNA(Asn)/glutamyl-tRNA(Gln) amidotransferase subunit C
MGTEHPHNHLSADYVRKVARLSRLAIPDAEVPEIQEKLSAVVTYFDRLRSLDLSKFEPLANVADTVNRLEEDLPGPVVPTETFMRLAPEAMPPFVRVPKVIDEGAGA